MRLALTATPSVARFAPIVCRGQMAEAFALAAELGYDGVELHLRQPSDVSQTVIGRLAREYRLGIPTLGTGMAAGEDGLTFSDPDPEVRRRAVERIKAHIDLAADLASAVTIGLIRGKLGSLPEDREVRRAAVLVSLEDCCEAAAKVGVVLLLEPLNRYECDYLNTLDEASTVIEQIGASNLRLLADTFHMNIEEVDMAASLRRVAAHLGHVHLVDSNRQTPGHGHLDVEGILMALHDVNYQGYLSFEVLPLPDPRSAAVDGANTVRALQYKRQARFAR